ncbi:MAG: hypothetical protein HY395_00715 [Candidatus Doudnabacteria bacterium]|nr:hypothetical protein [Candidatus Doudnabacteria bacterium]
MKYYKIAQAINEATPKDKVPKLTPEQLKKIKTVSGITLAILGVAGIIAITAIAPGLFAAVGALMKHEAPSRKFTKGQKVEKLKRTFYYLKNSGLINFQLSGSDWKVYLTELGKKKLDRMTIDNLIVKKPNFWNGKWWQVAADIPTKQHRRGADLLRGKLKDLNFYPLQRTLWLYPYDPREEIEFIVNYFGIGQFVTVMEINRLDKQDKEMLVKFFKERGII